MFRSIQKHAYVEHPTVREREKESKRQRWIVVDSLIFTVVVVVAFMGLVLTSRQARAEQCQYVRA